MSDKQMTREEILDERMVKLQDALIRAQKTAKEVAKSSENSYHRYAYASAESIIAEARDALGQHGLAVTASWTVVDGRVNVQYILMHEDGARESFFATTPIVPEKGRPVDKAEATALTYNMGYFLRGLLLLPRVEKGAEVDARDDRNHDPDMDVLIEYRELLKQVNHEQHEKVSRWVTERGGGAPVLSKAIVHLKKMIAENQHNQATT